MRPNEYVCKHPQAEALIHEALDMITSGRELRKRIPREYWIKQVRDNKKLIYLYTDTMTPEDLNRALRTIAELSDAEELEKEILSR
jgi:hypothetical protein